MRVARVNVYLPDQLARDAKAAGLNISGLTQAALRGALSADRGREWFEDLKRLPPSGVSHNAVLAALAEAKDELEGRG